MTNEMKSIRVNILGREYPLRVDPEEEAFMREIASYVDARMQKFRQAYLDQPELTTAVVAALTITEELFTLRKERQEAHDSLDAELDTLSQQLAEALAVAESTDSATPPLPAPAEHEGTLDSS